MICSMCSSSPGEAGLKAFCSHSRSTASRAERHFSTAARSTNRVVRMVCRSIRPERSVSSHDSPTLSVTFPLRTRASDWRIPKIPNRASSCSRSIEVSGMPGATLDEPIGREQVALQVVAGAWWPGARTQRNSASVRVSAVSASRPATGTTTWTSRRTGVAAKAAGDSPGRSHGVEPTDADLVGAGQHGDGVDRVGCDTSSSWKASRKLSRRRGCASSGRGRRRPGFRSSSGSGTVGLLADPSVRESMPGVSIRVMPCAGRGGPGDVEPVDVAGLRPPRSTSMAPSSRFEAGPAGRWPSGDAT